MLRQPLYLLHLTLLVATTLVLLLLVVVAVLLFEVLVAVEVASVALVVVVVALLPRPTGTKSRHPSQSSRRLPLRLSLLSLHLPLEPAGPLPSVDPPTSRNPLLPVLLLHLLQHLRFPRSSLTPQLLLRKLPPRLQRHLLLPPPLQLLLKLPSRPPPPALSLPLLKTQPLPSRFLPLPSLHQRLLV